MIQDTEKDYDSDVYDFGKRLIMKKRGRPKSNEADKKVAIHITVSRKVLEAAEASGNASQWFDEAGKEKLSKRKKNI